MDGYAESFQERGRSYDRAMRRHPRARDAEFAQLIERARLAPGMSLGDVPAGGGYLARLLPPGVRWTGHEPCASFREGGSVHGGTAAGAPLLPFPWRSGSLERVVSLAGLHHEEDKRAFHREARRVLAPGGLYVVSDVAAGSPVAGFLDGFVGAHNSTGHAGLYLGSEAAADLEASGFEVLTDETLGFHWVFPSEADLDSFCVDLFDLGGLEAGRALSAAREMLGVDDLGDSAGLRWSLRTLVCRPLTA